MLEKEVILCETKVLLGSNDVIYQRNADTIRQVCDPYRRFDFFVTRFAISAWVIVDQQTKLRSLRLAFSV